MITTLTTAEDLYGRGKTQLTEWRTTLEDEFRRNSPATTSTRVGTLENLRLSIAVIEGGVSQLGDGGYDFTTLRLGQLLRDAGHTVVGADATRNYGGEIPFLGSLAVVDERLELLARQAALDVPPKTQTPEEIAFVAKHRQVLDGMRITADEGGRTLVARNTDGDVLDDHELPDVELEALRWARASR